MDYRFFLPPLKIRALHYLPYDFGSLKQLFQTLTIGWCVALLVWSATPAITLAQSTLPAATSQANVPSIQPYLDGVKERVTEFTLDNGLKFIVLENHEAPVISFATYANVGGVDEPEGKTGVAHFLEHLAFKGTQEIGTKNYAAERPLLERSDQLFTKIKLAIAGGNDTQAKVLEQQFEQVQTDAAQYVKQNELGQIVEREGGVGLNAATSADYTIYFYSFPSNKLELWMSLESERFLEPVFREFYKEKEVILEERRLRTDNSPIGKMLEVFLDTAFLEHPYKRPVIGYDQDIRNLTRDDVKQFFAQHYVPDNLTIAMVGDVDPQQVQKLAQIYFGRYQAQPLTLTPIDTEPTQTQTRSVSMQLPSQPWYLEGYHRPDLNDPQHPVYEVITTLLSQGRTSRFYQSLIEEQQVALTAQGLSGFPGDRYPNLVLFYLLTAPGHTLDEAAAALQAQIEKLKTEPVTATELQRVKTQIRAELLRSLDSNSGMARLLAEYDAKTGSWQNLFQQIDAIAAVTPEDVLTVARQTFTPENRTIGRLLPLMETPAEPENPS